MYMHTIPLIKLWNFRKRKIHITHHRTPYVIYMCILLHTCGKSPERAWKKVASDVTLMIISIDYLYLYWLTLLIISISVDSFQRYWWCWWSKNPAIWLDEKHNCLHPTKSGSLICFLLDGCLHAKKLKYQLIFKGILLIQTSCNLIRPKVNLDTLNQSGILWCYLTFLIIPMHKIKDFDWFFTYRDTDYQIIWLDKRYNWLYTTRIGSLICHLNLMILSVQKTKILIDPFQRYR